MWKSWDFPTSALLKLDCPWMSISPAVERLYFVEVTGVDQNFLSGTLLKSLLEDDQSDRSLINYVGKLERSQIPRDVDSLFP